jgi:SAM-dependent methyltransferase
MLFTSGNPFSKPFSDGIFPSPCDAQTGKSGPSGAPGYEQRWSISNATTPRNPTLLALLRFRPMSIDHVASSGFEAGAGAYERARPGYPSGAVAWLLDRLKITPSSAVLDLGAGTGKLTQSLVPTGARVVAVEPVDAMRSQLAAHLPSVATVAGTAEAIPLATGSVDAVVVAQAFHWFDATRALDEIHRVVRPWGGLGLVWNARDLSVDWVAEMARIVDAYGDAIRRYETEAWRAAFPAPGFGPLDERRFPNVQEITPAGIVERAASTSFIARLPENERMKVLDGVRELIASHPQTKGRKMIAFPHETRVYCCDRMERV